MPSEKLPVKCMLCGEELEGLDFDHWCDRAQNVLQAAATGDVSRLEERG